MSNIELLGERVAAMETSISRLNKVVLDGNGEPSLQMSVKAIRVTQQNMVDMQKWLFALLSLLIGGLTLYLGYREFYPKSGVVVGSHVVVASNQTAGGFYE